jgi:hypothetical protein
MNRRLLAIVAVILLAILGSFVISSIDNKPAGPAFTRDNLSRLAPGMSPEDVETILGPSTGKKGVIPLQFRDDVGGSWFVEWANSDGWRVYVFFLNNEYVRWVEQDRPPSVKERVRKRMGL